jgi:hypothetical protein
MRNFLKNTFSSNKTSISNGQVAELLGTKQKKIIRRYKASLKYINSVKEELLQRSREFMTDSRHLRTR